MNSIAYAAKQDTTRVKYVAHPHDPDLRDHMVFLLFLSESFQYPDQDSVGLRMSSLGAPPVAPSLLELESSKFGILNVSSPAMSS